VTSGETVVRLVPSPKLHAWLAIAPSGATEAEALKDVGDPGGPAVAENPATGPWSGNTTIPSGSLPAGTVGVALWSYLGSTESRWWLSS
jgi:hypothetical protein